MAVERDLALAKWLVVKEVKTAAGTWCWLWEWSTGTPHAGQEGPGQRQRAALG